MITQEEQEQIERECKYTNGTLHELEMIFRIKILELEKRIETLEDGN